MRQLFDELLRCFQPPAHSPPVHSLGAANHTCFQERRATVLPVIAAGGEKGAILMPISSDLAEASLRSDAEFFALAAEFAALPP